MITTNEKLSTFEVAQHMFARWRQENFFRYMRQEFALDHLCTYTVEPADPKRLVAHPERQKLDRQIRAARTALGQLVGRRGEMKPGATLRVKGRTLDEDGVDQLLREREDNIKHLQKRRDAFPQQVPLDEVLEPEQIVQLERERKLLTDAIKMIAYRAESHLARDRNDKGIGTIRAHYGESGSPWSSPDGLRCRRSGAGWPLPPVATAPRRSDAGGRRVLAGRSGGRNTARSARCTGQHGQDRFLRRLVESEVTLAGR